MLIFLLNPSYRDLKVILSGEGQRPGLWLARWGGAETLGWVIGDEDSLGT